MIFNVVLIFLALSSSVIGEGEVKAAEKEDHRVVGGVAARPNEFPWLVNLIINSNSLCGGSILNNSYILTAAHCVEGANPRVQVTAGDHNRTITETTEQKLNSTKVIVHPNYNRFTMVNDIALIQLNGNFTFNAFVGAARLASPTYNPTGQVSVAGWGTMLETSTTTSAIPMKANLTIVARSSCATSYNNVANVSISDRMICAAEAGKDSCQGDSGGPLLCTESGSTVVCGIVSFGVGCARASHPGVYTRVNSYRGFIDFNNAGSYNFGIPSVIFISAHLISLFVQKMYV